MNGSAALGSRTQSRSSRLQCPHIAGEDLRLVHVVDVGEYVARRGGEQSEQDNERGSIHSPALPMAITRGSSPNAGRAEPFQAIAEGLMADGIPHLRGKTRWYPATIKAVVTSDNAALV